MFSGFIVHRSPVEEWNVQRDLQCRLFYFYFKFLKTWQFNSHSFVLGENHNKMYSVNVVDSPSLFIFIPKISVADPVHFFPDPDPT